MKLSIIAPVLESYQIVTRQILYLNTIMPDDCELIIADDGSSPAIKDVSDLKVACFPFKIFETGDKRKWSDACAKNKAVEYAQADRYLFFDIDHILTREAIEHAMTSEAERVDFERACGILTPQGSLVCGQALGDYKIEDSKIERIHENNFMMRRDVWKSLGGFDSSYCGRYGGYGKKFRNKFYRKRKWRNERKQTIYVFPGSARDAQNLFHQHCIRKRRRVVNAKSAKAIRMF